MPCACTNGAAATTRGCREASSAAACQFCSVPLGPVITRCEATPRMRSRTSVWKPFITDSTTISTATPSAMPTMEMAEMKLMKRLRRLARV